MGVWRDKKTGKWMYKFNHLGVRYRRKGFAARSDAIQAEGRKREELNAPLTTTPLISLQQLGTKYIKHCSMHMAKNTYRQKSFVYRNLLGHLGQDVPAEAVSKSDIEQYLYGRFASSGPKAANRDLRDIKALFNWAIIGGDFHKTNPASKIMNFPETPYHPYVPPVEDVAKIKLTAQGNTRDFIETLYHTFARRSELVGLVWEDINFEQRWVRLWTRKRKGGGLEAQYKPMNDTVGKILYRRWKNRDKTDPHVFKFSENELRFMMSRLCAKAGVRKFGFHAIRHHVLSVINDSGKASMKQVQELAGHKRQSTTETYLHSMNNATREAAAILDQKNIVNVKSGPRVAPEIFGDQKVGAV